MCVDHLSLVKDIFSLLLLLSICNDGLSSQKKISHKDNSHLEDNASVERQEMLCVQQMPFYLFQ